MSAILTSMGEEGRVNRNESHVAVLEAGAYGKIILIP